MTFAAPATATGQKICPLRDPSAKSLSETEVALRARKVQQAEQLTMRSQQFGRPEHKEERRDTIEGRNSVRGEGVKCQGGTTESSYYLRIPTNRDQCVLSMPEPGVKSADA